MWFLDTALADVGLGPSGKRAELDGGGSEKCRGHNSLFDPDRFDRNESGGICGLEATELVHGGLVLVVQTLQVLSTHCHSSKP